MLIYKVLRAGEWAALQAAGVTVHGDRDGLVPADDTDWGEEYLSLDIALKVVDGAATPRLSLLETLAADLDPTGTALELDVTDAAQIDAVVASPAKRTQQTAKACAEALGMDENEIETVDDDLGRSAAGTIARAGFERMVAEVCLGKVGAVAAGWRYTSGGSLRYCRLDALPLLDSILRRLSSSRCSRLLIVDRIGSS